MIKLSKRLYQVASFVDDYSKVIDVGCDHAKLAIYLAQTKKDISVIASDNSKLVYQKALASIKAYQLEKKIDLRLGSGLEVLKDEEVDTIIMAGLGGFKITFLLKEQKNVLKTVKKIIIQANNGVFKVRKELVNLGYFIDDEKLVKEHSKLYIIICFKRGKAKYSKRDFLFGPILRKRRESLYFQLLNQMIIKDKVITNKIPKKYWLKRCYLKKHLKLLKGEIIKKDSFFNNLRNLIKQRN